ncbi:MAG: hypothetical protein RLT05_00085, partial [Bauldia litoralis]
MRRGLFGGIGLAIVVVIGIVLYLSFFIVDQTQQALVLRFGDPVHDEEAEIKNDADNDYDGEANASEKSAPHW